MVAGGMKCVKYLLFAFNLIFFIAGLALIICGAIVYTKFSAYLDFFGSKFNAAAILLMVVGGVIFVIGFFGCCGAYKENYCMVMTFAVLLAIVFILEIAAGIAAYVMRDQVEDFVVQTLTDASKNYGVEGKEGVTKAWDTLQHDFQCCGTNNYTDWSTSGKLPQGSVPDSCCDPEKVKGNSNMSTTEHCGLGQLANPSHIYTRGCVEGFSSWIQENIYIIGGVGIGLAFVELVGIILACCLGRTIKKEYEVV